MAKDLVKTLADLKEQEVIKMVEDRLNAKEDPLKILEDARKGMEIVGKRFAGSEYFIPDLVYSGEILKSVSELVKPKLSKGQETRKLGKIVFGTVAGDIHDIGKDIVVFMLDVNGFEVYDLGVDVPAQKFVEKVKETAESLGFVYLGDIPEDPNFTEIAYEGKTVFDLPDDSPAVQAAKKIADQVLGS